MVSEQPNVRPAGRYSVTETCRLLGVHRNTLLKWRHSGFLRPSGCHRVNGRMYYTGLDIIKFWNTR